MRILLVEDEKKIAALLVKALKSEGFNVDHISDGEEGSYAARTNEYDLIILDYQLPNKNGLEICSEIRTANITIPILVLSIVDESSIKTEFLNSGADDYVTKPFSFDEILARIHALLRRPELIAEEILIIDDITLDSRRHTVKRDNKEITLTTKEFSLLEYLMRNEGFTLSKGKLLEHVWDMNVNPFSNTIETHIRTLRKKLNQKNSKHLIKTISGRGYKMSLYE